METKKLLYCNCCGKRILSRMEQDVVTVEQRWGYFSEKDGEIHRFCICESCYIDCSIEQCLISIQFN